MSDNIESNTKSLSQAPMRIADLLSMIQAALPQESWVSDGSLDESNNEVSQLTLDEEPFKENRTTEIPHYELSSTESSFTAHKTGNHFPYVKNACEMQAANKYSSSEEKRIPLQDCNRSNLNSAQKSSLPWYKRPECTKKPIQPIKFTNRKEEATPRNGVNGPNVSLRTPPVLFGSNRDEPAKMTSFKHTLLPVEEQDSPQSDTGTAAPQGTSTPFKPSCLPSTAPKFIPSAPTISPPSEIFAPRTQPSSTTFTSPTFTAPSFSTVHDITPLNLSIKPNVPDKADSISNNAPIYRIPANPQTVATALVCSSASQSEITPSSINFARSEENQNLIFPEKNALAGSQVEQVPPPNKHINTLEQDCIMPRPLQSTALLANGHGSDTNMLIVKAPKQIQRSSQKVDQEVFKIPEVIPEVPQFKTLMVNGKPYTVLARIGVGGSSEVFKVLNPEDSSLYAVKCVNLAVESSLANGYINEIRLLKKLQNSERVVTMFDFEYVSKCKMLHVVMELGDTDLSKVLKSHAADKTLPGPLVLAYWTEMLSAVKYIHANGIIHSDLKPANFLLVRGRIKLIDFGIASAIAVDATSIVKETATGTFNYISPEAIFGHQGGQQIKISCRSDVWSLGCILYSLIYGKTPFSHITKIYEKMAAIGNPKHPIEFPKVSHVPPILISALRWCLERAPKKRPSVKELIDLPYMGATEDQLSVNIQRKMQSFADASTQTEQTHFLKVLPSNNHIW